MVIGVLLRGNLCFLTQCSVVTSSHLGQLSVPAKTGDLLGTAMPRSYVWQWGQALLGSTETNAVGILLFSFLLCFWELGKVL